MPINKIIPSGSNYVLQITVFVPQDFLDTWMYIYILCETYPELIK